MWTQVSPSGDAGKHQCVLKMNSPETKAQTTDLTTSYPPAEQSGESDLVREIAQATGQSPNDVTSALLRLLPERILDTKQTASPP